MPYLVPNQAQKHVTLNESLLRFDKLMQLTFEGAPVPQAPADPAPGACYRIASDASGDWADKTEWVHLLLMMTDT